MDLPDQAFAQLLRDANEPRLLDLARTYDSLTPQSQAAMRAEFARRGLEAPLVEEPAEPGYLRYKTVARYRDLSEAIVARSMLESSGMAVHLYDENLVRLDWQVSNFIGGIRLQVDERDEAAALELLSQPVPEFIAFDDDDTEEFAQPRCPVCNSAEITFEGASRGAALVSLYVLAMPLPPGEETWSCTHCGARWQDEEEDPPALD